MLQIAQLDMGMLVSNVCVGGVLKNKGLSCCFI